MKALTRNLLASAMLTVLPVSGAMACAITAWDGATGAPTADSPSNGVPRYSGECALEPAAAGSFVTDNSPAGETDYRARFYVFTGSASGSPVIFRATSDDAGAGTQLIAVTYTGTAFSFSANGATGSATGIQANKWYSVEFYYDENAAFTATVQGAGSSTPISVAVAGAPGAGTIGSASLGAVSGGSGVDSMKFDEFESTRSTTTAIGRLTVGNANAPTDAVCDANDLSETAAEVLGGLLGTPNLASGQPDCTEDGAVDAQDLSCIADIVLGDLLNGTTCGA